MNVKLVLQLGCADTVLSLLHTAGVELIALERTGPGWRASLNYPLHKVTFESLTKLPGVTLLEPKSG